MPAATRSVSSTNRSGQTSPTPTSVTPTRRAPAAGPGSSAATPPASCRWYPARCAARSHWWSPHPPTGRPCTAWSAPDPAESRSSTTPTTTAPTARTSPTGDLTGLADGFAQILAGCHTLLRPGGVVVVTARPWRKHGQLVDLPSAVIGAGVRAGLTPADRCVALLAAVRDDKLVARPSFFQLQQVRRARATGTPMHLIAHEDVLVFINDPADEPADHDDRAPTPAPPGDRHTPRRYPTTPRPTSPESTTRPERSTNP